MKTSQFIHLKFTVSLIILFLILSSNDLIAHKSKEIKKVSYIHSFNDTTENISAFLSELKAAYDDNRQPEFDSLSVSPELENKISSTWNKVQFYPTTQVADTLHSSRIDSNRYEVRNIPIHFHDASDAELTEYLVLEINNNNTILDLRLGILMDDFNELIARNDEQEKRKVLNMIQSIEAIKTAYYLKSIPELQEIFANRPINQTNSTTPHGEFDSKNNTSGSLTLIEHTDYMGALESDLTSNKWIHLNYENIEIVKHDTQDDIYGIKLRQHYNLSGKKISGYVFYLFDTHSDSAPQLLMQVWQHSQTAENKIFKMDDIEIM